MQSNFGVAERADGNEFGDPRTDSRSAMDQALDLESQGNEMREERVKRPGRHAARDGPHPIFERRRKPGFRVNIDHDSSAGPKKGQQAKKGFLRVGAMLNHAHAEDFVEEALPEWKLIDAGLKDVQPRFVFVICVSRIDRTAQIEGKNLRPGFERKLREAPGSASGFQNALAWERLGPTRAVVEPLAAQIISHDGIDLQRWKLFPLKAERGGVVIGWNEARHGSHNRVLHPTLIAMQYTVFDLASAVLEMTRKRQRSPTVEAF
jgi:hypothetical protein